MSGPAENLYHLDFEVKTLTRCSQSEGTCATVAVQFLDNPEQTVCEIPPAPDASKSDGKRIVGQGKKFTFAIPGGSKCGGPKPIRVTVRVYQGGRTELGSGELQVVPSMDDRQQSACGDEQTVAIKESVSNQCPGAGHSSDRDIVATLTVRARAWCAGPLTSETLVRTGGCGGQTDDRQGRKMSATPCGQKKPTDGCCGTSTTKPTSAAPCAPRRQNTKCPSSCPLSAGADQSQKLYTTIGCEIDGRKVDLCVRKKNLGPTAVQKKIVCEAEAFANMVSTLVSEIKGMVPIPRDAQDDSN